MLERILQLGKCCKISVPNRSVKHSGYHFLWEAVISHLYIVVEMVLRLLHFLARKLKVLVCLRAVAVLVSKIYSLCDYLLRKNVKTLIQHQAIKYDICELSPLSVQRLSLVKRKIMVLDLDETLVHSHTDGLAKPTPKPSTPADFTVKVTIDRHPVRFHVHKRPHADFFLNVVSQWYDLAVFTASMEVYGAAVTDQLDRNKGVLKKRYYRQHCKVDIFGFTKDLRIISSDLSSIFIIDNSPGAYRENRNNGIPIVSWFADPSDKALLNLLPVLDALRFTSDVRSILSRNLHQPQY